MHKTRAVKICPKSKASLKVRASRGITKEMDAQVLADLKDRGVDPALIAKLQAAAQAQLAALPAPSTTAPQPSAPQPSAPQPSATQPSATQPSLPAAAEPRRSGRARTSRTVQVDGQTVLRSNNYDVTASHYVQGTVDPAPAPAQSAPRPTKRPRVAKVIGAGDALRLARNDRLRAEVAKNETARAQFFDGHKVLLAPFSSALPALKRAAKGKALGQRKVRIHVQPEDIGAELRDYQLQSLDWFADLHERCGALPCILGDEMGLGKTLQTISYLAWLKFEKKLEGASLVLCPLSVLSTWLNECQRWCPKLRVLKLHSSDPGERERLRSLVVDDVSAYDVVVTTYEMAKSPALRSALVQRVHWRTLVLDEGHVIKNHATEISQVVRKMHFVTALILSGTPLQNNLVELWALLNFLYPQAFPDKAPFEAAYDLNRGVVDPEALCNARAMLNVFMLRRLKSDVETGLPPKLETVVHCPLAPQQLFWYRALLLKDRAALGGGTSAPKKGAYKSLMNLLMQLRKTCCHPFLFPEAEGNPDETTLEELVAASGKLRVLDRLLVKLHAASHRVVIFSQFGTMVDMLDDYCRLRGWPFCRLTGATNRVQRVVHCRAFNEPCSPLFIFLMTTRAGGLGINLQSADTCFLYDSDWNPQADLQAMARVHRLGQTKTVHVYRLCAAGTAEERILQRSQKKLYLSQMVNSKGAKVVESEEEEMGKLDGNEVLSMLKFGAASMFRGETNREPTDEELDKIIDRSRTGELGEATGALHGGLQADCDTFDATEAFVSTRELFGQKIDEASSGPSDGQDIAKSWQRVTKRERKQRIVMVSGGVGMGSVPVLNSNNYDLNGGEQSIFARELQGQDSSAFVDTKRTMVIAGRDYAHETEALCCFGKKASKKSIVKCAFCPMVFHEACAKSGGYADSGELAAGRWRCPQHACSSCARSTSAAGGLLFRCEACPTTLCEDCLPDACQVVGESRRLISRGVPQQSTACYIRCSDKCSKLMATREKGKKAEVIVFADLDLPPIEEKDRDAFAEAFLAPRPKVEETEPARRADSRKEAEARERRRFETDLKRVLAEMGRGDEDAYDGEPRFRVDLCFSPPSDAVEALVARLKVQTGVVTGRAAVAADRAVRAAVEASLRAAIDRGLITKVVETATGVFDEVTGAVVGEDDGCISGSYATSRNFAEECALERDGAGDQDDDDDADFDLGDEDD